MGRKEEGGRRMGHAVGGGKDTDTTFHLGKPWPPRLDSPRHLSQSTPLERFGR